MQGSKILSDAVDRAAKYLGWAGRPRAKNKIAPGAPAGQRCLVRQMPPDTKVGAIWVPEVGMQRPFVGILIAAGDLAADKLYDAGWEIGDTVWYGKFAGLKELWERNLDDGDPACEHQYERIKCDVAESSARACSKCPALIVTEPLIVVMSDDMILSEELQERFEKGSARRVRCETKDGKTRFVTERVGTHTSTWEINAETEEESK